MADELDIPSICTQIAQAYSPCDVSDALLKLHVPSAGFLRDISPIPNRNKPTNRLVAPISTVLFVDNAHTTTTQYDGMIVPSVSNLPNDKHFSDIAPPGSVVLMQQPSHHIAALLGDIVATRYKIRGITGLYVDGRARDVVGCGQLCQDGKFQCWAKKLTSPGTSLQGKPWAVDVPIRIGEVIVKSGDLMVADEAEMVCCVIPRGLVREVLELLVVQKEADDGLLRDVQGGMGFREAVGRWPGHYTHK